MPTQHGIFNMPLLWAATLFPRVLIIIPVITMNCTFLVAVCDYYVHLECQDFVVSDCKECATYTPNLDRVSTTTVIPVFNDTCHGRPYHHSNTCIERHLLWPAVHHLTLLLFFWQKLKDHWLSESFWGMKNEGHNTQFHEAMAHGFMAGYDVAANHSIWHRCVKEFDWIEQCNQPWSHGFVKLLVTASRTGF